MKYIRHLIYEAIKQTFNNVMILNEGLSSVLYHYTTIESAYNICKEDTIYLQSAFSKDADNYDKKRKYYLSCTRLYGSQFGYSGKFSNGGVRIILDGDKLSHNFKGKSVNYWNGLNDKYSYYKNMPKDKEQLQQHISWDVEQFKKKNPNATQDDIQHFIDYNFDRMSQVHHNNETEDRILSYEPVITDAHNYIISVDVLIPNLKEDEEKKKIAYSFIAKTPLSNIVRIFDSTKEFNSPKGKNLTFSEIMGDSYFDNPYDRNENNPRKSINALNAVIQFIAYANPKFEGKNFGQETAKLLQKYELSNFTKEIGFFAKQRRNVYSINTAAENLNSVRRDLSDRPNRNNSNILKMMTDYFLSIGANSFKDAYMIKKQMQDEYYNNGYVYDRIDTNVKQNFMLINYNIILDPSKESFYDSLKYALNWNDDYIKQVAESIAYDIIDNNEGNFSYNKQKTKGYNSMFQYIYKLFRKGTISQTLQTLAKMGVTQEYLNNWGMDITEKQLDYWDASRYDTINTTKHKMTNNNYDFTKVNQQNNKEIEQTFPKLNK